MSKFVLQYVELRITVYDSNSSAKILEAILCDAEMLVVR